MVAVLGSREIAPTQPEIHKFKFGEKYEKTISK